MSADADPVFETREALEAWVENELKFVCVANKVGLWQRARNSQSRIRRVTAAHQHLKETPR